MLEDVLRKANVVQSAVPRLHRGGQSPFRNRCGSNVPKIVASRSSYYLPTVLDVGERHVANVGSAGDFGEYGTLGAFGPVGSPGTDTSRQPVVLDNLMTLGHLKAKIVASQKMVKNSDIRYSRACCPNSVPEKSSEKSGWIFTEETLSRAHFEKLFTTGPEDPLGNKHCFYCMLCKQNV